MELLIMLDERRQTSRQTVSSLAKIELATGAPLFYCVVADTSGGGIRVQSSGFHLPDEFKLVLCGHGRVQQGTYRVMWRNGEEVGAKLIRGD